MTGMSGNGWNGNINLDSIQRQIAINAERGAALAAEHILAESVAIAPIEEGTLGRSGKTSHETKGDVATAAVSFDTPYAVRQHEELDYRHDAGRTAKYLERPLHAEKSTAAAIVANEVRKAL